MSTARALARRLLLAAGRVPRYVTVGERSPQSRVWVTLEGLGTPLDVTETHVMVSLHPLTVALVLPGNAQSLSLRLSFFANLQMRSAANLRRDCNDTNH